MLNKQLKFEGKIPTVQKLLHSHKIFKFQGQFDLEGQGQSHTEGQGHQFLNSSEIFK